jgi:sarcosine oxidase subunit beta
VATGHEGNGIGLAPITGQLIAQMIAGEKTAIDVEPLKFSRFDDLSGSLKPGHVH